MTRHQVGHWLVVLIIVWTTAVVVRNIVQHYWAEFKNNKNRNTR